MLRKIAQSGLDNKDAKRLGFESFTKDQLKKKYPQLTSLPAAGFVIPYYDQHGKPLDFFRYRYLEEPQRKGFDAITAHKAMRYIQPAQAKPRVYFSRLCDWSELFNRPPNERPLIITEGELKASCAVKHGLPCLGLGGVWNFKTKETALIKDISSLAMEGISVYIIYDSDARSNYQVLMAENALAGELLNLGASIFVVRLPPLEPTKKTGLDDFIESEGTEKLLELCESTQPWVQSAALHKLNEEVVFVHDPGSVLELKTLQRMTPHNFANSIYANRLMTMIVEGQTKSKTVKLSTAHEWLKWPARAEVKRVTYMPGQPRITEKGELNTWAGWGMNSNTVQAGNIKPWRELLDFLFQSSPKEQHWFEQWLAYPLQHPGTKLYSTVVIWGTIHGTGKTLIGYTMQRIYGSNFAEIADRDLLSSFNEWAENKQFVMGDEITGGDKRASGDRMKGLITQRFLRINPKFISPYVVPDCVNYYFTSNHPDSFFLEDSDRRYFIHEVNGKPLQDSFYREYDRWYKSDAVGALFHYLLGLDLTDFNPEGHALVTTSKSDMVEMGRSEAGEWVAHLREDPDHILKYGSKAVPWSLMTTEELFHIFDPTDNKKLTRPGLARELRRNGFKRVNKGATVYTKERGPQRLWAVRNELKLLSITTPHKLGEIYDNERHSVLSDLLTKKKEKF